ncbi:hypothetical protein Leryth_000298 [Lithospermum erythrorhizon]|nr:hypothetical protein Leryth_000298 [Lithospermum erythrorhizon]
MVDGILSDKDVPKPVGDVLHQTQRRILKLEEMNKETVSFKMKEKYDEILDDGFKWKKSYYKCAARGCDVKKLVERDEDDPSYYTVTYRGGHTCSSTNPEYLKRCL